MCTLYGNKHIPSDTYLRERLDEVDPTLLRKAFTQVFAELQRGKGLEGMAFMQDHYLLSIDGAGYFHPNRCIANSVARSSIEMARLRTTINY